MIVRQLPVVALFAWAACSSPGVAVPSEGRLARGTWGGDSGGLVLTDAEAHLHIGCTYGDFTGTVLLDADGRFDVPGSYTLRAYPISIGPSVPARFAGRLQGSTLTITATVNDTVQKTTVIRGPVSLKLGVEPRMANCPICRIPPLERNRPLR